MKDSGRVNRELSQALEKRKQEEAQGLAVHYPGPDASHAYKEMPNPTPEQVENDPVFHAIWETIKTWDINAPEYYFGYCGANGSHVVLIMNAIEQAKQE